MVRERAAGAVAVLLVVLGACSGGGGSSEPPLTAFRGDPSATTSPPTTGPLQDVEVPELVWYSCRREFECATFRAPTDYRNLGRDTVFLTIEKIPASDPDRRIGTLLVNPGGPGGSGNDFVTYASLVFPPEILARFDIVGFDPRGVGESTTIDCIRDPLMEELMYADWADPTPGVRDDAISLVQEIGDQCSAAHRVQLPYVGTVNAARDLDLVRRALGEEQITYVGFSYGTKLGAVYATLYPDQVRAMVLDGALVSGIDPIDFAGTRAAAFETAYASFARACQADPTCPIREDPVVALRELLTAVAEAPLSTDDDLERTVTRPIVVTAVGSNLYDIGGWPLLAEAIAAARAGNGDLILELADQSWGRNRFETFGEGLDAFLAITCADQPERPTLDEVAPELDRLAVEAPLLGPDQLGILLSCTGWPEGASPVPDVANTADTPLVVIGTTNDPATPYEWAQALADDLGSAVTLTSEGDGHTAFPWNGCMRDLVVPYLVDLVVPPDGARCGSDQVVPPFGFGTEDLLQALLQSGVPYDAAACLAEGLSGELEPADLILLLIDDELTSEEKRLIGDVAQRCVESLGF